MKHAPLVGMALGAAIGASFIKWAWVLAIPGAVLGISIANWWSGANRYQYGEFGFGAPPALVMTLNAIIYGTIGGTAVALLGWVFRPRIGKDRCNNCRYGLTGNVSGICPECGAEIEKP